jgi:hypothetical protein
MYTYIHTQTHMYMHTYPHTNWYNSRQGQRHLGSAWTRPHVSNATSSSAATLKPYMCYTYTHTHTHTLAQSILRAASPPRVQRSVSPSYVDANIMYTSSSSAAVIKPTVYVHDSGNDNYVFSSQSSSQGYSSSQYVDHGYTSKMPEASYASKEERYGRADYGGVRKGYGSEANDSSMWQSLPADRTRKSEVRGTPLQPDASTCGSCFRFAGFACFVHFCCFCAWLLVSCNVSAVMLSSKASACGPLLS